MLALALAALAALAAAPPDGAAPAGPSGFRVTVLGAQGGLEDGDLSAFLVEAAGATAPGRPAGAPAPGRPARKGILVDAGTLVHGIDVARKRGAFPDKTTAAVLRDRIGPVLITHPHFDHVMGLIIGSPDDVPRTVYGLPPTLDALRDDVFNGVTWAPFSNEGRGALGRYTFARLLPGIPVHLADAGVDVTALPLAHAGGTSTAFFIDAGDAAIVYCGDTGPDAVEHTNALSNVLAQAAPLVRGKRLAAVFLESSYETARPDAQLFGHLTPRYVMAALHELARDVDLAHPKTALAGLDVVITHIKPALDGKDPRAKIVDELRRENDLGVTFLVPAQGDVLILRPRGGAR